MRMMVLATFSLFATPALAAKGEAPTTEAVKASKATMKEARAFERTLDRVARRWNKGVDQARDRKVARLDAKLGGLYRQELARLRGLGVPTKVEVLPVHPFHPDRVPQPEHPKLESLRDTVVALDQLRRARDGSSDVKGKERRLLGVLQDSAEKRYERSDRRFESLKG